MKHVIVGAGNLGLDLMYYGMSLGDDFKVYSAARGFKYPSDPIDSILDEMPDHVWVTAGAGSVQGAINDFRPYADLHIRLVMELAQKLPPYTWLHTFSTNYIAKKSLYSLSKKAMEDLLEASGRKRIKTYRVQSLYGFTKPLKTFPFKLIKNNPKPSKVYLPTNPVVPTPTNWLAKTLLDNISVWTKDENYTQYNVAPKGHTTVCDWGRLVLDDEWKISPSGLIDDYPTHVDPVTDLIEIEDWESLWHECWGNTHQDLQNQLKLRIRGANG